MPKRRLEEAELTHSQAASRARADTAAQLETVRAMAREEGQSEARSDVSSELEQARAAVAAPGQRSARGPRLRGGWG